MHTETERHFEFLGRVNRAMRTGLRFDCVFISPGDDGFNFSRKSASDEVLHESYTSVADVLGASGGIAVPRAFDTKADPLVRLAAGHGFTNNDQNPNVGCMGLVLPHDMIDYDVALGVPAADAPVFFIVHTPTGITGAASGIWGSLPEGTVGKTIALIKVQVELLGREFSVSDLWVITSPGARGDTFFVDTKGARKLLDGGADFGINGRILPLAKPIEQTTSGKTRVMTHSLDLTGLLYDLLLATKIPEDQIYFDERNNMTTPGLPSKRRADETGIDAYSSGLLAGAVIED